MCIQVSRPKNRLTLNIHLNIFADVHVSLRYCRAKVRRFLECEMHILAGESALRALRAARHRQLAFPIPQLTPPSAAAPSSTTSRASAFVARTREAVTCSRMPPSIVQDGEVSPCLTRSCQRDSKEQSFWRSMDLLMQLSEEMK